MKIPEHRAAARIAWRQTLRAKGRTALIVVLVGLPVMALAGAGFVIRTALATPEELSTRDLGSADLSIVGYSSDLTTKKILSALPPGSQVASSRAVYVSRVIEGTQISDVLLETSLPADRIPYAPRYVLLHGRMPHAANEVAIHPEMIRQFGAGLGEELVLDDLHLTLHVVGIQTQREDLRTVQAVVGPGTFDGRKDLNTIDWLIDLPKDASAYEAARSLAEKEGAYTSSRADVVAQGVTDRRVMAGASFAGAALALFGTGLIAAAAFGVGARRQLRAHGLLCAAGGEPRHVRATVLWGGASVGLVGSLAGVAAGIGFSYLLQPHMNRFAHRIVPGVRLDWMIIAGAIVLGTIAATLAALGPGRTAARSATVDALAGRTAPPRAPGRLARRGFLAVTVGGVLTALTTMWHQDKLLAGALVVTLAGFLFSIPLLVTWVGRVPARLPTPLLLAARQTARYGRRTGAAVAAATVALIAPVAIAAFTLADEAYSNQQIPIAQDQMILSISDTSDQMPAVVDAARGALPGSVGSAIRSLRFPPNGAPEGVPDRRGTDERTAYVTEPAREIAPGAFGSSSSLLAIGTADLLRALHAERGIPALEAGRVVTIGGIVDHGVVHVGRGAAFKGDVPLDIPAFAASVDYVTESSLPRYVISERAANRYGFERGAATQALLKWPHDLTKAEVKRVHRAMGPFAAASAESRSDLMLDSTPARLLITGASALVALIIVAVAVALIGAESRREHAMIVAVGAEPGTRRKMVAASAFLVSSIAGVLAVPAGFLPIVIIELARRANRPIVVPWSVIGLVALGAPLIAAGIAAAASREPTSRSLLQPTW